MVRTSKATLGNAPDHCTIGLYFGLCIAALPILLLGAKTSSGKVFLVGNALMFASISVHSGEALSSLRKCLH